MIKEYKKPVPEPISQPFCFPDFPVMYPPMNKEIKDAVVMANLNDDSCKPVKESKSEKIKLLITASANIAMTPCRTDNPKLRVSIRFPPFLDKRSA